MKDSLLHETVQAYVTHAPQDVVERSEHWPAFLLLLLESELVQLLKLLLLLLYLLLLPRL